MGIRFFLRFNFPFFILIPSGRIRKDVLIKSRMVISRSPSRLAFLASSITRFSTRSSCNSALSSIVIIRSSAGINSDRAFNTVVFPDPVPPLTKMLYPAFTTFRKNAAASSLMEPHSRSCRIRTGSFGKRRIVITGPFSATGSSTILTRDPSANRASAMGLALDTLRLQKLTICCTTSSSFSLDEKLFSHRVSLPPRSTKIFSGPFTIISVTSGSSISS